MGPGTYLQEGVVECQSPIPRPLPASRDQPLPTLEPQIPSMVPTYDLGMAPDSSMNMQLGPDTV